jgi:hypothetical protein
MVAARPWALLAAAGSVALPAYVYTGLVVQEPLAYTYSALCLYLAAKALAERTSGWMLGAAAAALVAPLVRDQLVIVPATVALAAAIVWLQGERARRLRGRLRALHWAGLAGLGVIGLVAGHLLLSAHSNEWKLATDVPGRMLENGLWALGAYVVGIGVFPFVVGAAMVVLPRGLERTRSLTAFHAVLVAGLFFVVLYTGVKASYIAATFEPRIVERNMMYATPLLMAATALFIDRRRIRLPALAASAALAAAGLLTAPYELGFKLYSDAPGTAILSEIVLLWAWTAAGIDRLLTMLLLAALVFAVTPLLLRNRPRVGTAVAATGAVLALAWSFTAELQAARASHEYARFFLSGTPQPLDWVDRVTKGEPAVYIGQSITNPNGIYLTEFWNRDLRGVWSTDGTAPGPGPVLTPDLAAATGELAGGPGYRYALADGGIDLVGKVVAQKGPVRLYRLDGPLRLSQSTRGLFTDGWLGTVKPADGAKATYARFATPTPGAGTVHVTLSRTGWCSAKDVPGDVLVAVGPLALGPERNGVVERVTRLRAGRIGSCGSINYEIAAPPAPFAVEVRISPLFVPNELDPASSERRHLGAQVNFSWHPGKPRPELETES